MKLLILVCLLALHTKPCKSDLYMHFPPGSNNRLNGAGENVANNARLFDSQVGCPFQKNDSELESWIFSNHRALHNYFVTEIEHNSDQSQLG